MAKSNDNETLTLDVKNLIENPETITFGNRQIFAKNDKSVFEDGGLNRIIIRGKPNVCVIIGNPDNWQYDAVCGESFESIIKNIQSRVGTMKLKFVSTADKFATSYLDEDDVKKEKQTRANELKSRIISKLKLVSGIEISEE